MATEIFISSHKRNDGGTHSLRHYAVREQMLAWPVFPSIMRWEDGLQLQSLCLSFTEIMVEPHGQRQKSKRVCKYQDRTT